MSKLSDKVYSTILHRLLRNELLPGESLNRRILAAETGISVSPVMEAILRLQTEGFLEIIPRVGTKVRIFRKNDVVGYLVIREALETQAARLYCGKKVSENLSVLEKEALSLDMITPGTIQDFTEEIAFHTLLVKLADCNPLTEEFSRIAKISLFCSLNRLPSYGIPVTKNNHVSLIEALANSSSDEAERVMRWHLRSGKEAFFIHG